MELITAFSVFCFDPETFIEKHNKAPAPYIWTKSASDILEKVKRGRETLNKLQTV